MNNSELDQRSRRFLCLAAILCPTIALTGMATHYVRHGWLTLLNGAVITGLAGGVLLCVMARRDTVVSTRIGIGVTASVVPHFDVWEELKSPMALPLIGLFFAIAFFVGLWPFRVRTATA
jgi:hypothetical protein